MKKKTKNILTTTFGLILALSDVGLYVSSRVGLIEFDMGLVELLVVAALSYLLIQAYNGPLQAFANKLLNLK